MFSPILRMKVAATNRGPAFTGTRTRSRASVASDFAVMAPVWPSSFVAADRREEDPLAVDGDLELVLVLEAANRLEVGARQRHVEFVLAIERKGVADADAADCPERQAFELLALRLIAARVVGLRARRRGRIADGQRAHAVRGRQITLEQRGRDDEEIGVVVEAERRVVRGQQRPDVHLDREQVADDVAVLGAIEAMQQRPPGIGRRGGPVELRGEP